MGDAPRPRVRGLSVIKVTIAPTRTRIQHDLHENARGGFGVGINKLILKFVWQCKGSRTKTASKRKHKIGRHTTCPPATVVGTVWTQRQTDGQEEQSMLILFLTTLQRQFGTEKNGLFKRWRWGQLKGQRGERKNERELESILRATLKNEFQTHPSPVRKTSANVGENPSDLQVAKIS